MNIVIIGSGGHASSIKSIIPFDYRIIRVYEPHFEVLDSMNQEERNSHKILGIGDNYRRKDIFERIPSHLKSLNLFHPSSQVDCFTTIGKGNQFFANTFINSGVVIGDNNIFNTASIIEHDCKIGNHNHISVNAAICGNVTIGNLCMIGAGSVVIQGVSICDNVTIGAGSVVIRSITMPGTYAGNPVRKIR